MAQAGKGKLNYRCPSCFMRDIDMDMFYDKDKKEYYCLRCQYRGSEEDVLKKMKWQDSVMALCMSVTPNSILIEKTDKAIA